MSKQSPTTRFRERSLMLNPAPTIGAALAIFAIAFGGLSLRLASGHDPALTTSAIVQPANGSQGTAIRTHASGAATGAAPRSAAGTAAGHAPVVTAASGTGGKAVHGDA